MTPLNSNTRPSNSYCYKPTRVQLSEFDMGGVLYHANYFHLYEQAREAFLAEHEYPYSQLVSEGSHLAIVESHQKFQKPIYYGLELCVFLWVSELKRTTLTFCYEITAQDTSQTLLNSAWTRQVLLTKSGTKFKTGRFPQKLLSVFQQFMDESS